MDINIESRNDCMIRRLRRRYTGYHFCAFCRMTRSVYTLCGFEKNKSVGFCVFGEFCGNYKQRSYKQNYTSITRTNIIRSLHEHLYANLTDKLQFWITPNVG